MDMDTGYHEGGDDVSTLEEYQLADSETTYTTPRQLSTARKARSAIAELEAENAELRKQNEILATTRRLEEGAREQAEATIERLTCCGTCSHCNTQDQPECAEAQPEWIQVELSQRSCHFTPSRWTMTG